MVRGSKRKSSKRRQAHVIEESTRKRGTPSKRSAQLGYATVESGGKKGSLGRGKKRSTASSRIGSRKGSRRISRGRKSR